MIKSMERVQQKVESVQVPAGYLVAGGLASTPAWVQDLTTWLELFGVLMAVLVGVTTLYINILRIKKDSKDKT